MIIIITMAGEGRRFKTAGYASPKYMIEVGGKTLFEWSLESLRYLSPHVDKYIFIVLKKDSSRDYIMEECKKLKINDVEIIELEELTDGQATTCMKAMPFCNYEDSIFVYNIDTYVEPEAIRYEDIKGDGCIPCFIGCGDHWSFVKVDDNDCAIEVREKIRISEWCSIGAYYFSSSLLFSDIYTKYYSVDGNEMAGEKYIAPLYNELIRMGKDVRISTIPSEKVHVLGTPEELRIFQSSLKEKNDR